MTKDKILSYLQSAKQPVTKRDLARAFGLKGSGPRVALKKILKTLENEGAIAKHPGGTYGPVEGLPAVIMIEVTDIDLDGDVWARPVEWNTESQGEPPRIELRPAQKGHPAAAVGDRLLARLQKTGGPENGYEAITIRRMDDPKARTIGIFQLTRSGRGVVRPTDKKARYEFEVPSGDVNGAEDGDLVVVELQPSRGLKNKKVRIVEVLGSRTDTKAISLISLHEAGLNETFPDEVINETKGMKVPDIKGREDLRDIPLVTIDGADARDFDDAVYAEPLDNGGFHLIIAIADVTYYVRPDSPLDKEAQKRGNSTYFPDRVVPMLPEALSNDLCSLRPKENRAAMAAHLWIDENGKLIKYKFTRAIIRSAARLIYEQVQAAMDGMPDDTTGPILEPVIKPLYAAYEVLDNARRKRGSLDLDLPERQIVIDDKGRMTGVRKRERLDAHKLIEEFMVLANVAAARAIEDKTQGQGKKGQIPCVYRVHDRPAMDKLDSAREFIESFGLSMPKGQVVQPARLNELLQTASKSPFSHLISMMVLRCQSQALYSPDNIGHFGLALEKYAHFTSPIRRYADVLVHRALVTLYGLGQGGMSDHEVERINSICEHISTTERTSMVAERSAVDRFTSSFLAQHIGATFDGQISGVTRFGLFINLNESGADGLVPIRSLPNDFYIHDEQQHALIGRRNKIIFRLGAKVSVTIKEADPITGSSIFELTDEYLNGADIPGLNFKKSGKKDDFEPRHKDKKPGHKKPNDKKKDFTKRKKRRKT
jgi:ribonuclease R